MQSPASKAKSLLLYVNGEKLGKLGRSASGALSFQYDLKWIFDHPKCPISLRLPIQEDPYEGEGVNVYLKNLLPDSEEMLNRIAALHRIPTTNPFDILTVIGRDCVGAIQFLPETEEPADFSEFTKEKIKVDEIAETIRLLKSRPLGQREDDDEYFRISISGAQEKFALLKWNGAWYRPIGLTPTTHIIKPSVAVQFDGVSVPISIENEWLSLKICELFGLRVASASLEQFEDLRVLVVERFDRTYSQDHKNILRIIQEDFCQATATPPHLKYESKGGPGIGQILGILNESEKSVEDRAHFFKTQIVFWLLAAIDGHAKNFSIQWSETGFALAPLYDVMSADPIVAAKKLSSHKIALAMAVEGKRRHYRIYEIFRRHWEETASRYRIPSDTITKVFEEVIASAKTLRTKLSGQLPKDFPSEIIEPILDGIERRVKSLE